MFNLNLKQALANRIYCTRDMENIYDIKTTENAKKRVKMFTSNTKRDFYLSVYTIFIRMAPKTHQSLT